jgi:hypothetical protein
MANSNGWGDGAANNAIGWGQGANNNIGWGDSHAKSWAGSTDIVGLTTDSDAQAFITAAGITDATQKSAIDTLVKGLKSDNIWTKMKAIYPFVGGTATTHKYNLKDPRDLDAAFRLVFNGGWTHSSNGATPNGTNGYADTKLNANTNLTNGNFHLSFYSRTNSTSGLFSAEMLLLSTYISSGWVNLRTNNKVSGTAGVTFGDDVTEAAYASSTTSGFMVGTETSNSLRKVFKNNSLLVQNTTTSTTAITSSNIALSGSSVSSYSANQAAFISIGDGLLDSEASALYNRVQTFQQSLNRAV